MTITALENAGDLKKILQIILASPDQNCCMPLFKPHPLNFNPFGFLCCDTWIYLLFSKLHIHRQKSEAISFRLKK